MKALECLAGLGRPIQWVWLAALLAGHAMAGAPTPQPLGKLEPFWRHSAVLGPVLEQGYALEAVPEYLQHGDFPYRKRPYPREVLFADHLSVVRLLGGYQDGSKDGPGDPAVRDRDLAWRDAAGRIHTRLELLRPRLQPWIDAGYTDLTLVLDNIPWCFPETPGIRASYGQGVPPRNPEEWGDFVRAVCREVAAILGPDAANRLRFRVGTENNGRERFDGTLEQYQRHYEASARAVKAILPGAQVGPFNISGISLRGLPRHNVNALSVAEFAVARGLPWDWVAYSRYFRPGDDPLAHARACREVWEEFERRVPALHGVSREIHEFGVAPWGEVAQGIFASAEPGAAGAALTAQIMWRLREAGIGRLWHWLMAERIRDRHNELPLLTGGPAWVLSVLEHMAGGEATLIEPLAPPPDGGRFLAAVSIRPGRTLVMIAATHPDLAWRGDSTVRFRLPVERATDREPTVRVAWLTRDNSPYDVLRSDLAAAGLLAADFATRPDRVGSLREMAADRSATLWAADRLPKYRNLWVESLTLKPVAAAPVTVTCDPTGLTLTTRLAPPSVLVLDLR